MFNFDDQQFISITILNGESATEMHNRIVAAFPSLINVATILDGSHVYYLIEQGYDFGFSRNELRQYLGLSALVETVTVDYEGQP